MRYREGARKSREQFAPVGPGLRPEMPLDLYQIDHTLADVIVVNELDRRPVGRPWLTLVIDVASRMIAGFYLSPDSPSSTSVALAISHAVLPKQNFLARLEQAADWPVEGIPKVIHLDNAKEFHSRALARGCREHGIQLKFRPVRTPHFGGHIERLIGTLMGDLHLLPGTTFSSTADRGDYPSEKAASLTLHDLERWLTIQIANVYHLRTHRGIGVSPLVKWNSEVSRRPSEIRRPADPIKLYIDFLPAKTRLIRRDGIRILGIHYWDNVLSPLAGRTKQKHLIRYDPRDLSHVFVKIRENAEYTRIPYANLGNPPISASERRAVVKQLRAEGHTTVPEKQFFAAVDRQRAIVDKACKETASARREREKRKGLKAADSGRAAIVPAEPSAETPVVGVKPYKVEVWE
jgi:putative transposase